MKKKISLLIFVYLIMSMALFNPGLKASVVKGKSTIPPVEEIEKKVRKWMEAGKIPGLTLVIVRGNAPVFIRGYGYAHLENNSPVTADTLFELGSCSKSFTALAALELEKRGLIKLDSPVSHYLPWFYVNFNNQQHPVTLRQCIQHTSGIPRSSLSYIRPASDKNALENTVKNIVGIQLNGIPGEHFEYATINYDIVGAVIEKITGRSFEEYMRVNIFNRLGLSNTFVGAQHRHPLLATGYKGGFFLPRKYSPPIYRGNNPAGYVISNGRDMARWLRIQLGMEETGFFSLVPRTHQPNLAVAPTKNMTSYAMGWYVNPYRNNETFHRGLNPNFTTYIGFRPKEKIGVAVLVNSNSPYTAYIGPAVIKLLTGEPIHSKAPATDKVDTFCSILSFVSGFYVLWLTFVILLRIINLFKRKYSYEKLTLEKLKRLIIGLLGSIPFLYGIYLIPRALAQLSWEAALVWSPLSFKVFMFLILLAFAMSYIHIVLSLIFPPRSKYRKEFPFIIVTSILSGLGDAAILFIITTAFFSKVDLKYLLYYFGLALCLDILGKKLVQAKLIKMANHIALDLRINLINKVLSSKFQRFEKIQDGRIFTTLNGDTGVLAGSARLLVSFATSVITLVSAFIYMTTISFSSTLLVLGVVAVLLIYFSLVAKKSRVFMEEARDAQNVYMGLINSMIRGFKELSIHKHKKYEFRQDLVNSTNENCNKNIMAGLKFLNARIIGHSIVSIILGTLSIVISRVISGVDIVSLITFVMVLLYSLGPLNTIIRSISQLTRFKVSWDRIKGFVKNLDVLGSQESVKEFVRNIDLVEQMDIIHIERDFTLPVVVENLKVEGLMFEYETDDDVKEKGFTVGPIDLEVNKGEALFITGGNGSGKTTLAKLVTGLYQCEKGNIKINGIEKSIEEMGEYFSTIYSNYHLFRKNYGIDINKREIEIQKYFEILNLDKKVSIKDGSFTTIDLSGGQRKRLALIQCWLEDRPIYLFDEVAADQDPEFRKFFYHHLLRKMKERGKIIIAITHDDHYFDVADKIIKMDEGKIEFLKTREQKESKKHRESPEQNSPNYLKEALK